MTVTATNEKANITTVTATNEEANITTVKQKSHHHTATFVCLEFFS